jgi:hypothetical protein
VMVLMPLSLRQTAMSDSARNGNSQNQIGGLSVLSGW